MSLYRPISWAAATAMLAACTEGITTAPPAGPTPVAEGAQRGEAPAQPGATASHIVIGRLVPSSNAPRPYVVIDGVPKGQVSDPLEGIDPKDIESLEVLKGPAAAQRFGSEAANGVILIRTKSGRGARPASEAPARPR